MIALVDYGLGNLDAFANIYRRLGIEAFAARSPTDLNAASRIILPGVGAFDWAMTCLRASGLCDALNEEVLFKKKPILGVCVGMQIMANSSQEGIESGLGWIDAEVVKFDTLLSNQQTLLPHMGWNNVTPIGKQTLFCGMDELQYYFLHSYFMLPKRKNDTIATSNYGVDFTSAVSYANIYGTQFHPEKSHQWGIRLLKNFADLC